MGDRLGIPGAVGFSFFCFSLPVPLFRHLCPPVNTFTFFTTTTTHFTHFLPTFTQIHAPAACCCCLCGVFILPNSYPAFWPFRKLTIYTRSHSHLHGLLTLSHSYPGLHIFLVEWVHIFRPFHSINVLWYLFITRHTPVTHQDAKQKQKWKATQTQQTRAKDCLMFTLPWPLTLMWLKMTEQLSSQPLS